MNKETLQRWIEEKKEEIADDIRLVELTQKQLDSSRRMLAEFKKLRDELNF